MTSINFNTSATTALRTLQATNKALETTQGRVSTGLKIGEAKDNAAYWSITTTLKSDNKALTTVKDALSLGAATVDTAYQGLNKSLEVLNEIKSKVTAASQDGVDKASLQAEISELQNQLKAISSASSFSGENWLSVNSSVDGFAATKNVVSSFSRDNKNNVTLSTIEIDTKPFILIDGSGTKEGILDAGKSGNSTLTGGIAATTESLAVTGSSATSGGVTTGAINLSGLANGDHITFNSVINGTTVARDITLSTANLASLGAFATALQGVLTGTTVTADTTTNTLTFTSTTPGATSNVSLNTFAYTDGTIAKTPTPATGFANVTGTAGAAAVTAAPATATMTAAFATFTLDSNDQIKFDVTSNGAARTVKIDQATIAAALGTTDGKAGKVTVAADYVKVLTLALKNANISDLTVTADGTNHIIFTGGADTKSLAIGAATASAGQSILTIDVTTADRKKLASYLEVISAAADKVTKGAASLGAIASRVDLQQTFVSNLIDTIEKGVSDLIDADLSEESTRLQALQTKQQLGVQALSIANSGTQQILRLFQ
jgi:flagellin